MLQHCKIFFTGILFYISETESQLACFVTNKVATVILMQFEIMHTKLKKNKHNLNIILFFQ